MTSYPSINQGEVTLVGFGPGSPDLLTLAGDRALHQADIIFYDDLIDHQYLNELKAEKIYVGKRSGHHSHEQDDINLQMLEAARQGKKVVRLKGGDAMIFAHGGEEIEYLESNHIQVHVIPGITTASALAATSKVPLTLRGVSSSVSLVNGHARKTITPNSETLVYYMGASQLDSIGKSLISEGWAPSTPVLLGYNISRPDEELFETTLNELHSGYPTPLIALIGDVASIRHQSVAAIQEVQLITK